MFFVEGFEIPKLAYFSWWSIESYLTSLVQSEVTQIFCEAVFTLLETSARCDLVYSQLSYVH